jgi:hypothetical protein
MAARLTDEERRLRLMTRAELADEVGCLKSRVAACRDAEEAVKTELLRRDLTEADGELFRVTLSWTEGERFSLEALREAKGEKFLLPFMRRVAPYWTLRCHARRREIAR